MIVLGIDPGFASCGLAAVELLPGRELVRRTWVVRTARSDRKRQVRASEDNAQRAREIARELEAAITEWSPLVVCAETMSWPRNASAAAKVALAWGVLCGVLERHRIPLVQASPQEVKKALCGRKDASKDDIIAEIERRFPEVELPVQATLQEHAADATAVVVACLDSDLVRAVRRGAA